MIKHLDSPSSSFFPSDIEFVVEFIVVIVDIVFIVAVVVDV